MSRKAAELVLAVLIGVAAGIGGFTFLYARGASYLAYRKAIQEVVSRQLAEWGVARRESVNEPEDHISALCETMRFAIAVQQRPLAEQKAFFNRYLYRGAIAFCNAVRASDKARFYKHVAGFAGAFLEVEREAFEIGG